MYILAVDSSAISAGAAVLKDGRLIAETYANIGLTHSETLMPMIDYVLKIAGINIENVDFFAVAAGPGSFTGVRIGVATVKGLCFESGKPCFAVSTLEALANSADISGCILCPVMDARRMQVYCAAFEKINGEITRIKDDAPRSLDELAAELSEIGKKILLIGDGSDIAFEFLNKKGIAAEKFSEIFKYQHASGVAITAYRNYNKGISPADAEAVCPFYLRESQAERNLSEKEHKNGSLGK